MSVLIKGVEMPKGCGLCRFDDYGFCTITAQYTGGSAARGVASFCPLVGLPEHHGDLIDADDLKEHLYQCETNGRPLHVMDLQERLACIDEAPTIIEAEGAEK